MRKLLFIVSLLAVGSDIVLHHQSQAQSIWKPINSLKPKPSNIIWENVSESDNFDASQVTWDAIPAPNYPNKQSTNVIWELIDDEDKNVIHSIRSSSESNITPPTNLEEAEALLNIVPLQSSDFKPLLNISYAVPTASVLSQEDWRLISSTISPFNYADGTGNQNYAIQLDYGLSDTLQISGFYSEADDPLNAQIKGLDIRPGNFWEVFGAAARWKFMTRKNWSLSLNSSLESWTVGSGGSDSFGRNSTEDASPNIFNNSGKRVETQNLIGSIALPLTWYANRKLQFTFTPGISFLPSSQGEGQGGAGEFYGNNTYIGGGLLWHPTPKIGLTASIAQPVGTGNNSFNRNLKYSKVPVFSGGLSWHLNPRIALQGQLTNGFGATPATALLTLPSDNRMGYSAKLVLIPDAADTPQPPLSSRQWSLSHGGLTVNTALIPPRTSNVININTGISGTHDVSFGHSISNIFFLDIYRSKNNNIPQNSIHARTFLNNGGINWRGSGKAVLTSPLRGDSIWSALRISFGRNIDSVNNSADGYLFAETPLTWESNSKLAFNIAPKVSWSGVGTLWGVGISANIQIAPRFELVPEANIALDSRQQSNSTLGLRWNAFDEVAIEVYGSTAPSIIDTGQLLNADEICWGSRLTFKF